MTISQSCAISNRRNEPIDPFLNNKEYLATKKRTKKAIKTRLCYVSKEGEKRKRLHDNLYRDLAYVTRANDSDTYISTKAQILLANLAKMICKNSEGEEFIDHGFLSEITHCRSNKQNRTILSQLGDIIDYKYHGCVNFQGKRRVFGYVVKFTSDGKNRIENPELFYNFVPSELVKNSSSKGKKLLEQEEKNPTSLYIDIKDNKKINRSRSSESNFNENEELEDLGQTKNFGSDSASHIKLTNHNQRTRRSLSEFYPISEEDARVLCQSSDRKFTLDDVNSLILKLSKKKPNHGFFTKELFMNYMKQALINELEPAEEQTTTAYTPASNIQIEAPVIDQTTPWGKIRASLRNHYGKTGDALDRAWFGKLVPIEGADSSKLVLKAPTNFICDYIEQHYLHTIQRLCSAQEYSFSLTV